MRTWVVGLALALAAAACSGDGSAGDVGTSPRPDTGDAESPFRLHDGPLTGLMLTPGLLEDGSNKPRLVFTTRDTQVTAVVALGDEVEQGAMLSMVWSSLEGIDDGDVLFTHDVPVGPGGEAFSVGVAETGLAPGRYEVAATLGDAEVRLPWRVEIAGEGAQAGKARMVGALAQVGDEDWNMPESGSSGWNEPTPTGPPPPPGPCDITSLNPGFDPMRTVDARVGWIGTCSAMKLDAAVSGSPTTVASLTAAGPATNAQLHGRVDLCGLPGGSDLPGTVVRWTATGSDGATASDAFTVPNFGESLMVDIGSVPEPGHVDPGQRIALRGMAIVLPTSLGVRELVLIVNGQILERVGNLSETSSPRPCDDGRFGAVTYTHYDVPQDAPPEIEICAHAVGFDGTEADHCIQFFTGEIWTGTVESTSRGADCIGGENGTVTLTVAGAQVTGSFEASGSYTCLGITTATSGSVPLSGTLDAEGFSLSVNAVDGLLSSSIGCLVDQRLEIPIDGDTASAHFEMTAPSHDVYECTFKLDRAS